MTGTPAPLCKNIIMFDEFYAPSYRRKVLPKYT